MLAAVAMLGGVLYASWQAVAGSDDPQAPAVPTNPDPDFSLTDEQAIARFKELSELRLRAYESADISLVPEFAGTGPFRTKVVAEIRRLKRDNVTASLELADEQLELLMNSRDQIKIQQTAELNIRFFNPKGVDVTSKGRSQHVVIDWTLEPSERGWLIATSIVTDSELED
jgi:hypothetical protein